MNDLHLHVKTEYFEAIKRGEKTEGYHSHRDVPYTDIVSADVKEAGCD